MEIDDKKIKTSKQLLIEIPVHLHSEIKIRATQRNITMRLWILRAIINAINNEKKYEQ